MSTAHRILLLGFLASAPSAAQDRPVAIRAARLLDGKGAATSNVVVVVQGARILRVERAAPGRKVDYDLGSWTLLPGLIDGIGYLIDHLSGLFFYP